MASKTEQLVLSLAGLITEAESLEPLLADRLKQISKWVTRQNSLVPFLLSRLRN
jgi:hypothetical protein